MYLGRRESVIKVCGLLFRELALGLGKEKRGSVSFLTIVLLLQCRVPLIY